MFNLAIIYKFLESSTVKPLIKRNYGDIEENVLYSSFGNFISMGQNQVSFLGCQVQYV
jgi:hypothetical protein